MLKID